MNIITFLAPKGGAGRTTAVMALASTFVERDLLCPLVIDATEEAQLTHRSETTLSRWYKQMLRCGVSTGMLEFKRAKSPDELERILQIEAERYPVSRGAILIDTSARFDPLTVMAAQRADLLVSPFTDALTAHRVSEGLNSIELSGMPLYGLRCGGACDEEAQGAVAAAFTAGRLLNNGLPSSDLFENLSVGGHLPRMHLDLVAETSHLPWSDPARDEIKQSMRANSTLRKLATEILLALDGYELRRRCPMPRRNALPLRQLGELLQT